MTKRGGKKPEETGERALEKAGAFSFFPITLQLTPINDACARANLAPSLSAFLHVFRRVPFCRRIFFFFPGFQLLIGVAPQASLPPFPDSPGCVSHETNISSASFPSYPALYISVSLVFSSYLVTFVLPVPPCTPRSQDPVFLFFFVIFQLICRVGIVNVFFAPTSPFSFRRYPLPMLRPEVRC